MGHGILADNDGVVDNDSQSHDQREQADHVHAASRQIEYEQCCGE